jgi:hypothetical protein
MNQFFVLKWTEKTHVASLPRPCIADDPESWECL